MLCCQSNLPLVLIIAAPPHARRPLRCRGPKRIIGSFRGQRSSGPRPQAPDHPSLLLCKLHALGPDPTAAPSGQQSPARIETCSRGSGLGPWSRLRDAVWGRRCLGDPLWGRIKAVRITADGAGHFGAADRCQYRRYYG